MAYFERIDDDRFRATRHTSGAWDVEDQHIAAAIGLLLHVVEQDRDARRDDALFPSRLSYDILGTLPVEDVTTSVQVLRPGRTVELVEARLSHAGRDALVLRAWLGATRDTASLEGTPVEPVPGPDALEPWDISGWWPGDFIGSLEVRRDLRGPGRALAWVRTHHDLLAGEPVSPLAATTGILDLANGLATRVDPRTVVFPNLDLTTHFVRPPAGGWTGLDVTVSFGASGIGLTSTVLHDVEGPFGTMNQTLTVRPVAPAH